MTEDMRVPSTENSASVLRLLVVDDHADTVRILGRLLAMHGHSVKTAGSVSDALDLASRERFDVLVSDVGLPDGSGYDLMRSLKSTYAIRGIAMSGYGMEEDLRKSSDAGFSEHLVKPLDFARLERVIRQVAGRAG